MMNGPSARRFGWAAALVLMTLGCGGSSTARYIPAAGNARAALQTALATWQSGEKHGPITSSKPEINVFDARWQAGKKLESFEILEEVTGQEQPQFQVRLKLEGQPEETATYLIVGIDPLHIFRDADYKKATGM
ncbi:MAG TPA: hypothetical protein VM165_08455 [Planctomycetaceae bacterium]|nr:hypothetical protein [Planctomycetaceae bacterium]